MGERPHLWSSTHPKQMILALKNVRVEYKSKY